MEINKHSFQEPMFEKNHQNEDAMQYMCIGQNKNIYKIYIVFKTVDKKQLFQDVEVTGDKDDSRSLHIAIHRPASSHHAKPVPLLSARFVFDDHIRCMAAKQRLSKGRVKARQLKMQMIERLLDIPSRTPYPGKSGKAYPGLC